MSRGGKNIKTHAINMYKEMMDWMRPQQKTTTKHPSIIMRERNHRHFHSLWDLYSYKKKQKDTRSLYFAVVYKVEKNYNN